MITCLENLEYIDGRLHRNGKPAGFIRNGYKIIGYKGKKESEHRLVFFIHHGYMPKEIDHINGNRSDNRIENLREATHSQNICNIKKPKNNTIGCKNVEKHRSKYRVSIQVNGKRIKFGNIESLELAELVAIEARNKFHGKFANHD